MKTNEQYKKNFGTLLGLSKKEILEILGDDFNFYPDKEWVYILKKYWWGKSKKLYIIFDDDDKVIGQYTIYSK